MTAHVLRVSWEAGLVVAGRGHFPSVPGRARRGSGTVLGTCTPVHVPSLSCILYSDRGPGLLVNQPSCTWCVS